MNLTAKAKSENVKLLKKKIRIMKKCLKAYARVDNWTSNEHAYNIFYKDYAFLEAKNCLIQEREM